MKNYFTIILLGAILLLPVAGICQSNTFSVLADPDTGPREHSVDMLRMKVELSFVPEKKMVKGKVTHAFQLLRDSIDTLFFDAPSITIKEALFNGKPINFETNSKGVTVKFSPSLKRKGSATRDSITFLYEATPKRGIYFIGWNADKNMFRSSEKNFNETRKQIWTQGQGIDNRHWIPMYDDMNDKLITETTVTFDKEYKVLSNGVKISEKENKDGTKTWNYRMSHPHASYLLMLGIGKYEVKSSKSSSGVPIHAWYYPEYPERMQPTYLYTEKMMDLLEKETGVPYPWESYSQIPVQEFIYGAMENTTATIFGDFLMNDHTGFNDRNYIPINVHELTHQWFGDYVTARSSKHTWLQESFATHYQKYFTRSVYGEDDFQWDRQKELEQVLSAGKKDRNPIVHSEAGRARVYPKGSLVLDMLRYVVGEEQYKRALKLYLQKHAYGNVDTHDFYQAFQDALGMNLDWFFDEWLYRGGEPQYEVSYRNVIIDPERLSTPEGQTIFTYSKQQIEITVKQTHKTDELTGFFKMPIVFQVHYSDGSVEEKKEWIENQTHGISIQNPIGKQVDFVLFDPGSQIIKTVVFKKSLKELKAQALKSKNMIDRYDAVVAMRDSSLNSKRTILAELFLKEKFYGIKNEILSQLGSDSNAESVEIFRKALSDTEIQVRKGAISNANKITTELIPGFEKALNDSSYEMIQTALEKLCTQFPLKTSYYLDKTKNYYGIGNSVRIKWLELSAMTELNTHLQELIEMTGTGYEFRTRINAMGSLQRLNYLDEKVVRNLFDAVLSSNNRLASPASDALNYYIKQNALKQVVQKYYLSKNWEASQKNVLDKFGK